MKIVFASIAFSAISITCFANNCFDSSEYKNSASIAKASVRENGAQLGKAVAFLVKNKNISDEQALQEVMRINTQETIAYDKALKEIGEKIRPMKPQSPDECSDLIKLQREYESIGKEKIHFIVNKIIGQDGANPSVNMDAAR
jgi:hypothetical protein